MKKPLYLSLAFSLICSLPVHSEAYDYSEPSNYAESCQKDDPYYFSLGWEDHLYDKEKSEFVKSVIEHSKEELSDKDKNIDSNKKEILTATAKMAVIISQF